MPQGRTGGLGCDAHSTWMLTLLGSAPHPRSVRRRAQSSPPLLLAAARCWQACCGRLRAAQPRPLQHGSPTPSSSSRPDVIAPARPPIRTASAEQGALAVRVGKCLQEDHLVGVLGRLRAGGAHSHRRQHQQHGECDRPTTRAHRPPQAAAAAAVAAVCKWGCSSHRPARHRHTHSGHGRGEAGGWVGAKRRRLIGMAALDESSPFQQQQATWQRVCDAISLCLRPLVSPRQVRAPCCAPLPNAQHTHTHGHAPCMHGNAGRLRSPPRAAERCTAVRNTPPLANTRPMSTTSASRPAALQGAALRLLPPASPDCVSAASCAAPRLRLRAARTGSGIARCGKPSACARTFLSGRRDEALCCKSLVGRAAYTRSSVWGVWSAHRRKMSPAAPHSLAHTHATSSPSSLCLLPHPHPTLHPLSP